MECFQASTMLFFPVVPWPRPPKGRLKFVLDGNEIKGLGRDTVEGVVRY